MKDYQYERIVKLIGHMDALLKKDKAHKLELEEVESYVGLARNHLQRIFKAYTKENICAYFTRHKMEQAAGELISSNMDISGIAYGFGLNPDSFAKSFMNRFKVSATEFRKQYKSIDLEYSPKIEKKMKELTQKPRFVQLQPFEVLFVMQIGNYENRNMQSAWEKLYGCFGGNVLDADNLEYFGLFQDDDEITEEGKCRYDACVTGVTGVKPKGELGVKMLDGGKYAVFSHKGYYKGLESLYESVIVQWLPQSGYELDNRPFMEKYLNDPEEVSETELLTDLYVPVK